MAGLTETWLCGMISDAELFGPEYQVFRRDRHSSNLDAPVSGGVLCAVRREVPCMLMDSMDSGDLELIIRLHHRSVYVITMYVPPGSQPNVYEQLAAFVAGAMLSTDELMLMGDFNLPSVDWVSSFVDGSLAPSFVSPPPSHVLAFLDDMASSGLVQTSDVLNASNRSLDLIFSSIPDGTMVRRCLSPLVPESGHHPALHVALFLGSALPASSFLPDTYCYNFRRADFLMIGEWLSGFDWTDVLVERDIDVAVGKFYDAISLCFSRCVPVGRDIRSPFSQPWLNSSLKHLKNRKCKAWKRFSVSRNDGDYMAFCNLHSQYVAGLEASYGEYISSMRSAVRNEPKQFWRFVNSKRGSDGYPSSMRLGDYESADPVVIADLFGDFFKTAFCDY